MQIFKVFDPEPFLFRLSFRPFLPFTIRLLKIQSFIATLKFSQFLLSNQFSEIFVLNRCLSYYQISIDSKESFS